MSWIHRPLSSSREIAATKPKVKDIWAGLKEPQDDNTREWPKKASPRGFDRYASSFVVPFEAAA